MRFRRFGRTGLSIPVFSCGGMRYQHSWQDLADSEIPADNQKNLEATIHRSLEVGINHIETARGYGTSEIQLGKVLPSFSRDKIIVQTKVGVTATGAEFRTQFNESMKKLQLDHVDLLSVHGINNEELLNQTLAKGGCLEEARKIQKEGRARFIGFSTHGTCSEITRAIDTGEFDYVNLHWYFVNHLNWPAIEAASRQDMGVFIISPNDKGGKLYEPPQRLVELCAPLTPMQFNDLYCLSRPEVHTLSLGAAKPSDFDEHIKALDHYENAEKVVKPIEERLRSRLREVWGEDWMNRWPEGLPDYAQTPSEVNLPEILRLYTYAKGLDLVAWGQMRYNLLGQAGHWFPGQHIGKLGSMTELDPALARSPFKDKIPMLLQEAHELLLDKPVERISKS
ncbi:MAG: aldo/keto reductase [Verrucomicrobiota bacterium]|nr:aldo/keto reductase [Verrucomicrobiota bacterium]